MRAVNAGLCLGALLLVGCASWSNRRPGEIVSPQQYPTATSEQPTAENLVKYLNGRAANLQGIDCQTLEIDTQMQGRNMPSLEGWMVCEKPKNFRLAGKKFGATEVDFGSNQEQFWFWVKRNDPPDLFHCSYADFKKGVQLPFPFQPEWVLEALGMAEYGPPDRYRVELMKQKDKSNREWVVGYQLIESTTSPQGQPVRKITVFDSRSILPPHPQVRGHILQDAQGRVICAATIKEVRTDEKTGVIYPRVVQLDWPAEKLSMVLRLDRVTINPEIAPQRHASLFSRPQWKNVKTYDLAQQYRVRPSSRAVMPASGVYQQ